jgi:uncharacterized protein
LKYYAGGMNMPPINLLIKPASSNCNLRCKYCFYHSISENREIASYGIMKYDILEALIKKGLEYADYYCGFAFQGGEPTISGLEFFEKSIEFQNKYNTKRVKIVNSLQTNGMFIDEKWAKFLHDNNFLVGLSLDGPKEVHNLNRVDSKADGSFNKVMRTVYLFDKYKVEYNILSVITSHSSRYANKIYNFLKGKGFKYLQFINCLDPLNVEPGMQQYSLKPEDLEKFLKIIFDRWYEDFIKGNYVSIRYFDNLITMLLGHRPEACNMTGVCQCSCVIEGDGGVYPCDFYVLDKWNLGNIKTDEIREMISCETAHNFTAPSMQVNDECEKCKWYALCRGGCRRERENFEADNIKLNYYCSAYKGFFEYSYERLVNVARTVRR